MIRIVLCFCIFEYFIIFLATAGKSGPYKSTLVRVSKCEKPILPVDPDPGFFLNAEIYNTSTKSNLLRGNITIVKDNRNKKIKAKGFFWEDGKWRINYFMKNMACSNVFLPVIGMATGVPYDRRTCSSPKGVYVFDNFDTNKIQHFWMATQEYGRIMWRLEVYSPAGSVFCWEFETLIEPDLKKGKKGKL